MRNFQASYNHRDPKSQADFSSSSFVVCCICERRPCNYFIFLFNESIWTTLVIVTQQKGKQHNLTSYQQRMCSIFHFLSVINEAFSLRALLCSGLQESQYGCFVSQRVSVCQQRSVLICRKLAIS